MAPNESPEISVSEMKDQVMALQRQVFSLLLALIVVSGTVTVYLYRQTSLLNKDIAAMQPQAEQIINAVAQNRAGITTFLNQLAAYAQANPAFQQQVMNKYGMVPQAAPKK